MTTYYVDAAAAGTADGLSPANAFVSVQSVPFAHTGGDVAWVRRSHKEDIQNNSSLALFGENITSTNSVNNQRLKSTMSFLIGWPDANGAYFGIRPAAGVSASWDTDNQATEILSVFSMNLPVFCSSNNNDTGAGFLLGTNTMFANMCFVNCGGGGVALPWFIDDTGYVDRFQRRYFNNITHLFQGGPMARLPQDGFIPGVTEKYTLIASSAVPNSSQGAMAGMVRIKQLVIHPKTQHQSIFRNDDLDTDILFLYNQSNSLANIANHTTNDVGLRVRPARRYIRRVSGIRPYSGFVNSLGLNAEPLWQVDDYYGDGPMMFGGLRKPRAAMVTALQAQYDGNRVMRLEISSEGPANVNHWGHFHHRPLLVKHFEVANGTPINIEVPIYVDATGVFSPAGMVLTGHLLAAGCQPVTGTSSTIIPGDAGLWTGGQPSGGTPYIFRATFNPTESAVSVPFYLYAGHFMTSSGSSATAFALFSEPNSAA